MYVTSGGRFLGRSDKLRSCGVSDGCTIQVTSRVRYGGRHKVKKAKVVERFSEKNDAEARHGMKCNKGGTSCIVRVRRGTNEAGMWNQMSG